MSEDVSATMRVGVTVILVAALVATVLNLMVMSQSILSNGQSTLQSGIDQVSQQEFETYNNKKVSGTLVQTAISLYQGRDIAIVVQTKSVRENAAGYAMNYGALLCSNYTNATSAGEKCTSTTICTATTGEAYWIKEGSTGGVYQKTGAAYYTGQLWAQNGLVQSSANTVGVTTVGNPQYLLSSARFNSTLIKDATGSIIGIYFKQVD
mgnify:CR=1 FL=1